MKSFKVKKSFQLDGTIYEENDEIKVTDVKTLVLLNEKGYIKPLSAKEIQNFAKNNNDRMEE